jgi:hypothetical protein
MVGNTTEAANLNPIGPMSLKLRRIPGKVVE